MRSEWSRTAGHLYVRTGCAPQAGAATDPSRGASSCANDAVCCLCSPVFEFSPDHEDVEKVQRRLGSLILTYTTQGFAFLVVELPDRDVSWLSGRGISA